MGEKSVPLMQQLDEEAVDLLWDQIFKTCRVYADDPVAAWKEHEEKLDAKAAILNKEQFVKLHYTAPGTDLTLGMPKNHVWESAGSYQRSRRTLHRKHANRRSLLSS